MNTDRLGKLMEAYRLTDENAGNDGGEERAKHEREIREHIIGGGEAAPDPWPDTVLKAQTAADLVEFLARLLWAKDNPGKDCPPDRIPTTETLAAWLPEFPEAAHLEAGERLAALYGLSDGGGCCWRLGRTATLKPRGEWSLTLLAWERPKHPLAPWSRPGKSGPGLDGRT